MKTKQEKYIESLEDQIERQRQTIKSLRADLERKKRQASIMSMKTLKLLLSLGIQPDEAFAYYAVRPVKGSQRGERKKND